MGWIDHVKTSKTTLGPNTSTQIVAYFSVHIQYFYNLPQTKHFLLRSLQPLINTKMPFELEIILPDSLEISLISHATTDIIIQN